MEVSGLCAVVRVRDGDEQGSVACGRGKRRLSTGAFFIETELLKGLF
jgi:hypothetical protein